MKKTFLYIPAFLIPISIMTIGFINDDKGTIYKGFSLFSFFFFSFLGSIISEIRKEKIKIEKKDLIYLSILLVTALLTIVSSAYYNKLIYGCAFSTILGIVSFAYLNKKKRV